MQLTLRPVAAYNGGMEWSPDVRRAVVLAAGRGKRLGSITANIPKPMVPVQGRPVLEHIVRGIAAAGVTHFLLVVGYRAEAIRAYFGDGGSLGVSVSYADQPVPNGTGAALLLGRDFAGDRPLVASYGDILTDPAHYTELIAEYRAAPCAGVLGINPVPDPSAGAAVFREGKRITRVVEKPPPSSPISHWNLAGVNAFGPEIFDALSRITPSPRGEYETTSAFELLIESGAEMRAYEMCGFWSDIGTPEALAEAERDWNPDWP